MNLETNLTFFNKNTYSHLLKKNKGILIDRIKNEFVSFNKSSYSSTSINQESIEFMSFILEHLNVIIASTIITLAIIIAIIFLFLFRNLVVLGIDDIFIEKL